MSTKKKSRIHIDGDKLVLTYVPDKTYAEYSMNWTFTKKAAETTTATK